MGQILAIVKPRLAMSPAVVVVGRPRLYPGMSANPSLIPGARRGMHGSSARASPGRVAAEQRIMARRGMAPRRNKLLPGPDCGPAERSFLVPVIFVPCI